MTEWEYEEKYGFWDENKSSVNGSTSASAIGVGADIIGLLFGGVIFLLTRMEITSSAIVALIPVLLTKDNGYEAKYYWLMFGGVLLVSLFLQARFTLFKILYCGFTCLVVAFFCYIWDKSWPMNTRLLAAAIGVGVTILLYLRSWSDYAS